MDHRQLWNSNTSLCLQESEISGGKGQAFKHRQEAYVSSNPEVEQLTEPGEFTLEIPLDLFWIFSLLALC